MHHVNYSVEGKHKNDKFSNFYGIKYPVAKGRGRDTTVPIDWDHEYFYFYDWNHEIERIYELTKNTDILYYTPEGHCMQHFNCVGLWEQKQFIQLAVIVKSLEVSIMQIMIKISFVIKKC